MDWSPYNACCGRAARDLPADVGFCPECGHALMRCAAFSECRTLVSPTQPCTSCLDPVLMIDAGAVVSAKAGERMSMPLIIFNRSAAGRPLWVKRIARRDGRAEEQLSIPWEQIDARTERRFSLDTLPMAEGGTYTLNMILVLATRYKSVEEEYAFAAGISVSVAASTAGPSVVNFTVSGESGGHGAGHNVIANIQRDRASEMASAALGDRRMVPLERAERYEIEQGIRGYRKEAVRVLRQVEFTFQGFRDDDVPPPGSALLPRGRLLFGRNSRQPDAAANAAANDVCLRAWDARAQRPDEAATMALSRHHFELIVVNDRLCLQARASKGMQVNNDTVTSGEIVPLVPGDRIVPIPGRGDKLTVRIGFSKGIGLVDRIDVSRTPVLPGD